MLPRRICAKHWNALRFYVFDQKLYRCSMQGGWATMAFTNKFRYNNGQWEKQKFVWQNACAYTALNLRAFERMNLNSNSDAFTANTTLCSLVCTSLQKSVGNAFTLLCCCNSRRAFESSRSTLLRGLGQKRQLPFVWMANNNIISNSKYIFNSFYCYYYYCYDCRLVRVSSIDFPLTHNMNPVHRPSANTNAEEHKGYSCYVFNRIIPRCGGSRRKSLHGQSQWITTQ